MSDWWKPSAAVRRLGGGGGGDKPEWGGSGGTSSSDRRPIGVPSDYTVPVIRRGTYSERGAQTAATMGRTPGTIKDQGPRYFDGDEFTPAALDPASIGRLQASLSNAGLLTDFRYGIWDERSRKAYADLLSNANAAGMTAESMLARMAQTGDVNLGGGGGQGGGGGGRQVIGFDEQGQPIYSEFVAPPLELRTTNKDDLRRAFRTAVIDTMGEGWSQNQINELVDAYNWQEIRVQKEAYDTEVGRLRAEFEGEQPSSEPISVVSPPSPETFLETELQRRDPTGYQAGQMVNDYLPAFFDMMGGWV